MILKAFFIGDSLLFDNLAIKNNISFKGYFRRSLKNSFKVAGRLAWLSVRSFFQKLLNRLTNFF